MRRNIKFKAWSFQEKRFLSHKDLFNPNGAYYSDPFSRMDIHLLEYTGLKDRNSVEIFEGDKLSWENGDYGTVVWNDECASFLVGNGCVKWGEAPDLIPWSTSEVIGNSYENPDFIKNYPEK